MLSKCVTNNNGVGMKSFKKFIDNVKEIPARIAKWQREFEAEQRRLEAERRRLAEHEAKLKKEADARLRKIQATKLEREQKAFEQDVKKNKSKYHEYLKTSVQEIQNLKKEINELHRDKKGYYEEKKELHREMDDLKHTRSRAIKASQDDADTSIFGNSVRNSTFKNNMWEKERDGSRAVDIKSKMNIIGSDIRDCKDKIDKANFGIKIRKDHIKSIETQRERTKKVLFKK